MSNEMVVGSIRSNVTPPLTGGIYEALLEKAQRERDEAREALREVERENDQLLASNKNYERDWPILKHERDQWKEESLEQARLLGMSGSREARLITERDHYKQALEEISTTIQDYKDSLVQEPAEDFIWAIKAWVDKKMKET